MNPDLLNALIAFLIGYLAVGVIALVFGIGAFLFLMRRLGN